MTGKPPRSGNGGTPPLPLALRLPNPPPLWVGRADSIDALSKMLERGPLAMVWGAAGIGNSALVRRTVHECFRERLSHTVCVCVEPAGITKALLQLSGVVSDARGKRRAASLDRDSLLATLIDRAEPQPGEPALWIVLEDVHNADPEELANILSALAQHARDSRWIAVGRHRLESRAARGQSIALGPMSNPDLVELSELVAGGVHADLDAAAGMPGRLFTALAGEPVADPLADESACDRELIEALAIAETCVDARILAQLVPAPDLRGLERRGLIEKSSRGVAIHEGIQRAVLWGMSDDVRQQAGTRAARMLNLLDAPDSALAGFGLLLKLRQTEAALGFIAERGTELLSSGHARALWSLLESVHEPELASFRLKVAVELGDPSALPQPRLPPKPSASDRECYARALFIARKLDESDAAAGDAELAARQENLADLAFDAGRLRVRIAMDRGDQMRAQQLLKRLDPPTPRQMLERDIDLAASFVRIGDLQAALELARGVEQRMNEVDGVTASLRFGVGWVLYCLGEISRAHAVLQALGRDGLGAPGLIPSRLFLLQSALAFDAGDLELLTDTARRMLAISESTFDRVYARVPLVHAELLMGKVSAALTEIDELVAAARDLNQADLLVGLDQMRERALMELGQAPDLASAAGTSSSRHEDIWILARYTRRVLWGSHETAPDLVSPNHPDVATSCLLAEANAELSRGAPARAASAARRARNLARQHGYRLLESEARCLLSEALLVQGHSDEWRALSAESKPVALGIFDDLARLEELVSSADTFDPGALEALTRSATPRAARRASALLGNPAQLDLRDRAFVVAARRQTGLRVEAAACSLGEPRTGPSLDLDPRRRQAWIDERPVDFDKRPLLWTILDLLSQSEQPVPKERLLREAWNVDVYHPLRHDARVHTAISALRKSLDETSLGTQLVVGSAEGYSLGATIRVRRVVSSE